MVRADGKVVVNAREPQFFRQLESLTLGKLLQRRKIRKCHIETVVTSLVIDSIVIIVTLLGLDGLLSGRVRLDAIHALTRTPRTSTRTMAAAAATATLFRRTNF